MKKSFFKVLSKKAICVATAIAISGIVPVGAVLAQGELVAAELKAEEDYIVTGKPGDTVTIPVKVWVEKDGNNTTSAVNVNVNLEGQTQHEKTISFNANEFGKHKVVDLEYTIAEDAAPGTLKLEVKMQSSNTNGNDAVWNKKQDFVSVEVIVDEPTPPADKTAPIINLVDSLDGSIFNETSLPDNFIFTLDEASEVFVNNSSDGIYLEAGTHRLLLPLPTEGDNDVYLYAIDAAGNRSEQASFSYTYDSIAPVVTATPDREENEHGWYNDDVEVSFNATDEGTGVAFTSDSVTVDSDGEHDVIGEATDNAGNIGVSESITIKIDKTAPIIEGFEDGDVFILNEVIEWQANDETSGLVTPASGTLETNEVGTYTVVATDKAGNSIEKEYTVVYNFGGILQPVRSGNTYKAGSTLPVKFQLTDNNGNYITDEKATISVRHITNETPDGELVDVVSTNKADNGINFRYDIKEQQHIYNLNTKNLLVGTYQIIITLSDGETYRVTISTK